MDPDARLLADDVQLLDRRGTSHVRRYEQRMLPLLRQQASQLPGRGRLARPLKAQQ